MIVTAFLLALTLSATGMPVIHGPVTNSLGAAPFDMKMSPDGKLMLETIAFF